MPGSRKDKNVSAMDWDRLRIFHAVAAAGSLTHAGEVLNLSQSAVSRQIRALEEALGVALFRRHARGLILTESGELLFDASKAMAKRLDAATARIRDSEEEVMGQIRVTTTTAFGTIWLAPRLPRLFAKYPDLKIDLILDERVLDLPMREADVAIRMKEPSQADLIRKRLMSIRIALFATGTYLRENGRPRLPEDLTEHRLICQNATSAQVKAGAALVQHLRSFNPRSLLTVNSYFGILQSALNHLGVAVLPDYVTEYFPDLEQVLPETESSDVPVYMAYPEELRQSKRVAVFRDFVQNEITMQRKQLRELAKT